MMRVGRDGCSACRKKASVGGEMVTDADKARSGRRQSVGASLLAIASVQTRW
ncbi:hypothetical protein PCL1606_51160 [Pseudomonas chlororaphis]|uniref:Uncharacterized protein n=1 Tax=Pseudomonas chlororaphis TaxID=587753 RepID=A0A0D5Y5F9_9PSED|nr:hypothetical protein PCL1606_51160 [Pseudomonas chlororaphis]